MKKKKYIRILFLVVVNSCAYRNSRHESHIRNRSIKFVHDIPNISGSHVID